MLRPSAAWNVKLSIAGLLTPAAAVRAAQRRHCNWQIFKGQLCMQEEGPAGSYNAAWVDAFVERLSRFDARMNQAVVDSGVLAGVPRGALARAGAAAFLA